MAKENISFELVCGKLCCLPMNYMVVACAMLDFSANKEICREMLKDVYYLWELVLNDMNKKVTQSFYKDEFGEGL